VLWVRGSFWSGRGRLASLVLLGLAVSLSSVLLEGVVLEVFMCSLDFVVVCFFLGTSGALLLLLSYICFVLRA